MENARKTKARDAWCSSFRKLSKHQGESYKKMITVGPFVAIGKKWLVDLLEAHCAHPEGYILTDIRDRIIEIDRSARIELCKCYRTPEGIRGGC